MIKMSKHGRNFNPTVVQRKPDTRTYEGAEAFSYEDARNELISAVATTFLDDKYYESGQGRMDRVRALIKAIADDKHYRFLWNLVSYTRDQWNLRSISHLLAGEYLLIPELRTWKDDGKYALMIDPAYILADKVFIRPDDVAKTFGYWMINNPAKANSKQKMPRVLRRAVNIWFNKMTRFQASKYQARLAGKQITLKKLLKMTHPKPKDKAQNELFKQILEETLVGDANWTKDITSVLVDEETGEKLTAKQKWEKTIPKMAYFALLNNLAAFDRAGVDPSLVLPTLVNPKAVQKSRVLPFRFFTALAMVPTVYKEALRTAVDHSFNAFKLPLGRYLIAVDGSGSMSGEPIEKAAQFGSILVNKAKQSGSHVVDLVMFSSQLQEIDHFDMGTMALYNHIKEQAQFGATFGHLVYAYANMKKEPYDYIFFLTDMQYHDLGTGEDQNSRYNWSFHTGPDLALDLKHTRNTFKPETIKRTDQSLTLNIAQPKGALIVNMDLQGYDKTMTPFDKQRNIVQLSGFSDKIFDYLEVIRDPHGLIAKIENS